MKISKEIIERIEGEANLELEWEGGRISDARVKFVNFRGVENILKNRHPLDALVISPRVCGICSHSHANAAVLALESCYEEAGVSLTCTPKAQAIRQIILNAEKIQNHLKWLFFSIIPELTKISEKNRLILGNPKELLSEFHEAYTQSLKMGAIFSGQWPHGSFAIPGGVCVDPVESDILQAKGALYKTQKIVESVLLNDGVQTALRWENLTDLLQSNGLLSKLTSILTQDYWADIGQSHDRFIVLGIKNGNGALKSMKTRLVKVDPKYVNESLENTFFEANGYTYSKSAQYKNRYFETGPLARMMIEKKPLIRDLHRRFKDALVSRIVARAYECICLIEESFRLLDGVDLLQPSYVAPTVPIEQIESTGTGIVEAARGSLIHQVSIKEGKIIEYDIITPTVWNLGNGSKSSPSVIQKALLGIEDLAQADMIFRGFDVCSVCTTQ
jgi:hydrogenase large subunit